MPDSLEALLPALPLLWQCICHSILQATYLLLNLYTWHNRVKALTCQARTMSNAQDNKAHHTLPQGDNKSIGPQAVERKFLSCATVWTWAS